MTDVCTEESRDKVDASVVLTPCTRPVTMPLKQDREYEALYDVLRGLELKMKRLDPPDRLSAGAYSLLLYLSTLDKSKFKGVKADVMKLKGEDPHTAWQVSCPFVPLFHFVLTEVSSSPSAWSPHAQTCGGTSPKRSRSSLPSARRPEPWKPIGRTGTQKSSSPLFSNTTKRASRLAGPHPVRPARLPATCSSSTFSHTRMTPLCTKCLKNWKKALRIL